MTANRKQSIRVNIGSEPPSLDPGLANDITSANVIAALVDPLVTLDSNFDPIPALAEGWKISDDSLVVTLRLRRDGRWSNGTPVTAHDFVWSWQRVIDPNTRAAAASRFLDIAGAREYNGAAAGDTPEGAVKAAALGVEACDDYALNIYLTTPAPGFLRKLAHHSFSAVHPATVKRHGPNWTEAVHSVTSGPFRLSSWRHGQSLTLEKRADWRSADAIALDTIEAVMMSQASAALRAFRAGRIEACIDGVSCIPLAEADRLRSSPDYDRFPALGTEFVAANVANIPDAHQRRALALALDRRWIVENITKAGELPATSLIPPAMPGFEAIHSAFLRPEADIARARAELALATSPRNSLTLYSNNDETAQNVVRSIRDMWARIGIETITRSLDLPEFLKLVRPPVHSAVDTFFTGWIADRADAADFFELAFSSSPMNKSGYCDETLDRLIMSAGQASSDHQRYERYADIDTLLTGPAGSFPYIPLFWLTYPVLRKPYVKGWAPNPLGQFDWTKVWLDR